MKNKHERRETAAALREARDRRSTRQQLERLDAMFGKDQGARRERARLLAKLESEKAPKA